MNSDKHRFAAANHSQLGTREHGPCGYGLHVAAGGFPRNAFSRADTGPLHGRKPVCINLNNAAHEG
jgi:hypothetical protein